MKSTFSASLDNENADVYLMITKKVGEVKCLHNRKEWMKPHATSSEKLPA